MAGFQSSRRRGSNRLKAETWESPARQVAGGLGQVQEGEEGGLWGAVGVRVSGAEARVKGAVR